MQGHLGVALALVTALSCRRAKVVDAQVDAQVDATTDAAEASRLRARIAHALAEVKGATTCLDRPRYLAIRRAVAGVVPFVRYAVPTAAEVIAGPQVVIGETAGAMGELDLAVTAGDCDAQRASLYQVEQALLLCQGEAARRTFPSRAILRGLSDAAFELGAEILESTPGTPAASDAVLADLRGTLDAISEGAPSVAPLAASIAKGLEPLVDRAALVVRTGELGAAIRALDAAVRPPYEAVSGTVSALSLPRRPPPPAERVELGRALFFDKRLSRGAVRSCASCHDPAKAWSDGRALPISLDPKLPLSRNVPSLLYAPLAAVLHWDGRIRTADAQALNVIHARAEMGLDDKELLAALKPREKAFAAAFEEGLTEANVGRALAAFEASALVPGNAPIDRFARGEASALTSEQRAGLDVFAGKGRCARCHVPPTFAGARPPDFTAPIYAVLGVPRRPGEKVLDDDRGRALVTGLESDERSFRTPTVRAVAKTAPYFHHGAFATLEQVVDFYDRGGGRGLGLDVPNQDPDVRKLDLTPEERRVLLLFLREALLDP